MRAKEELIGARIFAEARVDLARLLIICLTFSIKNKMTMFYKSGKYSFPVFSSNAFLNYPVVQLSSRTWPLSTGM